MKRALSLAFMFAAVFGLAWGAYRVAIPPEPESELSRFVPSGALLYLQAADFSSLLTDWNNSLEKQAWVKSKNFEVFSQSRLLLRLKDAGEEFSKAGGVPPDANLLRQVAGKQSALALYDIGQLQFLYITRISGMDSTQSALWQTRSKFESRTAGGVNFFYRKDPESGREVAFAVAGDYLLLATREDLMAGALQLLAGGKGPSVRDESWWSRSVAAAGAPGELRMILNLEKIVPSPYFRSYWIQQNISDLKKYSAAISDLSRAGQVYEEKRTLLRKQNSSESSEGKGAASMGEILRLVPAASGIYKAKADPDPQDSVELLTAKLLAPHLGPAAPEKLAPQVQAGDGEAGSASDLETRIDQAPSQDFASGDTRAPLQAMLAKNHILSQLQVQGTDRDAAGVFVRIHSAVAILGESDWDEASVRTALADFVRPAFTTARLGVEWKSSSGYSMLDGLWPLGVAVRGKYLIISDSAPLLNRMLDCLNKKPSEAPAILVAAFDHRKERENFEELTKFLDAGAQSHMNGATPEFFSENIASLSFALKNVASGKIIIRDTGDRQTQTVTYTWAR